MDAQLEFKLIECLDSLAQGESLDRILARYPQDAAQLRPLLETAASLPVTRMEPSEATKLRSRRNFMAQADVMRRSAPRSRLGFMPRFATGFLAAALMAVVLGTGAVAASGSALPGDPLYGLKRTIENVQLSFSSGAGQKALTHQFAQRRLNEINQLLSAGRPGEVKFTGTIEALQPAAWIVSGLVVQLDASTQILGTPQIDRVAEVQGLTGPKGLRASSILVEPSSEPVMTPTPVLVETPVMTETPIMTETPVMTETLQELETPAPTLTHAVTPPAPVTRPPQATARPAATLVPTATPEPVEVEFTGTVQGINSGEWNIDGTTVNVDANTQLGGAISLGQRVKVNALRLADGQLVAQRIELLDSGGGQDQPPGDQNSNDHQNDNQDPANNEDHNENHNDNSSNEGGDSHENSNDHNGSNSNSNDDHGNDH